MKVKFQKNDYGLWRAERILGSASGISGPINILTGSFTLEEKEILLNYAEKFFPKFELEVYSIAVQPGSFTEEALYFNFPKKEDEAHFMLLCSAGIEI